MSFGKDQSQLATIPAFGGNYIQRAKTSARRPQFGGGGGGGTFFWKGNYRPPMHTPEMVRLIAGEYPQEVTHDGVTIVTEVHPYIRVREHTTKQGKVTKSSICSSGPLWASGFTNQYTGQPCNCCPVWFEDYQIRKQKKSQGDNTKGPYRMGMRDMFAFNVWDYGYYFEIPDMDANGQMRMNNQTNQPYTSWVKGNPNDPRMQGRPWRQGMLLPWYMGKTHWQTLINYDANVVGSRCKTCGTFGSIVCVMKICGNPECGQYIYDPNSTTLSEEQREKIDFYPYVCPKCGKEAYVDEVIECLSPGCGKPERARIWDVDLLVQRMKSGDGQQTILQPLNHSEPRPISVPDPSAIKPLDLLKKFKPTSLEMQLKIHNLAVPPPVGAQMASPPPQMMQYPNVGQGVGYGAPVQYPPQYPPQPQPQQQQLMMPQMMQPPMQPPMMPPTAMQGVRQPWMGQPQMQAPPVQQMPPMQQAPMMMMQAPPMQGVPQRQPMGPVPLAAMPAVPYGMQHVPDDSGDSEENE